MSRRVGNALAVLLAAALLATACGGDDDTAAGSGGGGAGGDCDAVTLALVAYSVPKAANAAVESAFADTPEGCGVTWQESYGASGDQSRAVAAGLDADYVHFSLEGDVTRLVDAGLVAEDWNAGPTHGMVTHSVVVFAVRPGNPEHIESWDDLIRPGIEIVTPNPGSSGSARWNIMGAYASVFARGGSDEDAAAFVTSLFEHVVALPGSGRDATTAFLSGTGDVLLSYENEVILARQNGEDLDYVVPDETLLIENPGAVLQDADPRAADWLDFVRSPAAQAVYATFGFRPVVDGVELPEVEGANDPANPFPAPTHLLTIDDDFGGWGEVNARYFDPDDGLVTRIQTETGKSS